MPPRFSRELSQATLFASQLDFQKRTSPCEAACPAGMPIQKMNALIKENRLEEALLFMRSRNPFSGITGRICSHPCEHNCNRNEFDEGLAIRSLERFPSDRADMSSLTKPRKRESTGKKIAVIGSGPAGLTCAFFSALFGHQVTVFEALPFLGGMPRIGVPDFRLPKHIVDRDVGQILALGITAKTNTVVGKDVTLDTLLAEHDACLIAAGTWKEKTVDIPGAGLAMPGVSFLGQVNLGQRKSIGEKVAILGGGGVAFDCAFTAKRLGAKEVHIICVEGKDALCATVEDVRQAKKEGIAVHNSQMASRIMGKTSKITGVELFKLSGFQFDESGKLSVQPASKEKETLEADTVILAIGVEPDFSQIDPHQRLSLTKRRTVEVNPKTMATSLERVFAAGDVVTGPSSVAQAVGHGRMAAVSINSHLMGLKPDQGVNITMDEQGKLSLRRCDLYTEQHVVKFEEMMNLEFYEKKNRQGTEQLPTGDSLTSFDEIDKGFGDDEALAETSRCFHCGHCQLCGHCVEDCPGYVLTMTDDGPKVAYPEECWHCGNCRISCPSSAVSYEFPVSMLV
jgi:formate dehydrogenase (NADP+) beta subunit